MFHESPATTADSTVLPGVLWCPLVSIPATYRLGTPRDQHHAVTRWHGRLRDLATAIHETSGLKILGDNRLISSTINGLASCLHCYFNEVGLELAHTISLVPHRHRRVGGGLFCLTGFIFSPCTYLALACIVHK
jgi:hypothetical protein